jgi:hypothetical protein
LFSSLITPLLATPSWHYALLIILPLRLMSFAISRFSLMATPADIIFIFRQMYFQLLRQLIIALRLRWLIFTG